MPFSFGGNKVRIAKKYFEDMKNKNCNCMVSYGNIRSNLNRVIANICKAKGIPCYVISPSEEYESSYKTNNIILVKAFGASVITCNKNNVSKTISKVLTMCKAQGLVP